MKIHILPAYFLSAGIAFLVLSCQPADKKTVEPSQKITEHKSPNQEDIVVKQIMELPEIQKKNKEVEKYSKGKRHLSGYVNTWPTSEDPYYWVDVAEDNGDSYVTYYTFAVDNNDLKIKFYDPIQDSLISLEAWRKAVPAYKD